MQDATVGATPQRSRVCHPSGPLRLIRRGATGYFHHGRRSVLQRLKIARNHTLADLASQDQPVLTGRAEVDASVNARVGALPRGLREAREGPLYVREGRTAGDGEGDLVGAEDAGQHGRGGPTEDALCRGIVRHIRCVLMAVPRRVCNSCVVAVVCRFPDRRDRPPEVVNVANLEGRQ